MADDIPSIEDARHIDHGALREELRERAKAMGPGERTVEINGERFQLLTLKEWLGSRNQPASRWEVLEVMALIDQRKRYETTWARFWRAIIRGLNRLGFGLTEPRPPLFIKIPLSRIERRSR